MKTKYVLMLFLMVSCAQKKEAGVTRLTDAGSIALPVVLKSFTGKREGYNVLAEMTFIDSGSMTPLVIRFKLAPGVPTQFLSGDYSWRTFTGEVKCTSIDFMGGQGGVPSVAGTFTFTTPDGLAYCVVLPTMEMATSKRGEQDIYK